MSAREESGAVPGHAGHRRIAYDLLRIVSVCGVVAIHTFGAVAANPRTAGTATDVGATVLSSGFVWAVPVFVMLSGALTLADSAHRGSIGDFYRRRARRLIPALVVWTLVYLVLIRMLLLGQPIGIVEAVSEIADARVYPHLYFLWLVMGLAAVAPVLHAFLRDAPPRRAVALAAVSMSVTIVAFMVPSVLALRGAGTPIPLGALTMWIPFVGFYVAGFALSRLTIVRSARVAAGVVAVLGASFVIAQMLFPDALAIATAVSRTDYQGLVVAVVAVAVFTATATGRGPEFRPRTNAVIVVLSDASFGVYLVHLIVLLVPYELLPGFRAAESLAEAFLAYVVIVVVSFAISVVANRIPGIRLVF